MNIESCITAPQNQVVATEKYLTRIIKANTITDDKRGKCKQQPETVDTYSLLVNVILLHKLDINTDT